MNNKNIKNLKEEKLLEEKNNIKNELNQKKDNDNDNDNVYILKLKNKIQNYKNEIKDLKLRTQAEIENMRRRTTIDIEKTHKFALEKFSHDLLPVIDSLERSLELIDKSKNKISVMVEGIDLTLKIFLNTMKKFGIEVINQINIVFNPEIHQAISTIESQDMQPNHIIKIIQKGYLINNRLLRPAMVIVSKSFNEKKNNKS